MKVAELEFAFRMAEDLAPRNTLWRQEEVLERVASLHPAIEIPDSRYNRFERAGLAQLVADNACAHRFILGPAALADWRAVNLATHKAQAIADGATVAEGLGANVLGDPRVALTWLVNELSRLGLTLRRGEVVTTGTCIKPIAISVGNRIAGDFGVLGRVSVAIA
jgi:2-keto-4-pentenoate hydratase